MFPKTLPGITRQQMQKLALPFAIGADVVECYAKALREVLR